MLIFLDQWWRIPISQLTYVDQVHVLLALLLFYNLRIVERFMGSRKFLVSLTHAHLLFAIY